MLFILSDLAYLFPRSHKKSRPLTGGGTVFEDKKLLNPYLRAFTLAFVRERVDAVLVSFPHGGVIGLPVRHGMFAEGEIAVADELLYAFGMLHALGLDVDPPVPIEVRARDDVVSAVPLCDASVKITTA